MIGNILEDLNTLGRNRTSKTVTVRALSAAVSGFLLCCVLGGHVAVAQVKPTGSEPRRPSDTHAAQQAAPPARSAPTPRTAEPKTPLPDVRVLNQDGKRINFYSDLIKGKVFVISFVFTTCTYICPMQGESLSRIQTVIGERLGKDVNLIAVSADPETDTPERLKAWGAQFGAKPGWTLVTGEKSEIDKLARTLTGAPASKGEHAPVVFIGSDSKQTWVRTYGLAGPATFSKLIEEASNGGPSERGQQ